MVEQPALIFLLGVLVGGVLVGLIMLMAAGLLLNAATRYILNRFW